MDATERALVIAESDAVCEGCGIDPKNDPRAHEPGSRWFIDTVLDDDGTAVAIVRCPVCW